MSTKELLRIEPLELKFPFEVKKQISCTLQLFNTIDDYVAFKVKTTSPKKYCVRPNSGIVPPQSTFDVIVTMQAQREAPPDMQCKDKFLIQSAVVSADATTKDITLEMFAKDSGNVVEEVKLRVVYVSPPQPPSPVSEGSEEGSSPRQSSVDKRDSSTKELSSAKDAHVKQKENSHEQSALISRLSLEKNSAIQESNKVRQDMGLVPRGAIRQHGAYSVMFVVIVALLGILVGYLVRA